jgi:hypothetical protein
MRVIRVPGRNVQGLIPETLEELDRPCLCLAHRHEIEIARRAGKTIDVKAERSDDRVGNALLLEKCRNGFENPFEVQCSILRARVARGEATPE